MNQPQKINPPLFIWILLVLVGLIGSFQIWSGYTIQNTPISDPVNPGIVAYKSGIEGTVTIGPTCPVMREPPDPQCADKPYQASLIIKNGAGYTVINTKINVDGTFKFSLPPGTYTIMNGGKAVMPNLAPVSVTVEPLGYKQINLQFDSGIR